MAIKIWYGLTATQIGNWAHAANWLDTAGDPAASVPADGDDIYFTTGSQDVQASTISIASGSLDSLNFGTRWTGSFVTTVDATDGDTTNDALAAGVVAADVLDYANKIGRVELTGVIPIVKIQATSIDSPALKFNSCTIATSLQITGGSGTVLIDDDCIVAADISLLGAKKARLEIEPKANMTGADVTIDSGRLISYEELATVTQYGGLVEMRNDSGTTTTYTLYEGTCKYKPTGAAVLTTLINYGGFFDMRGCPSPSHTIGSTTMYAGAFLDERNGLLNTIYTTAIQMNGGIMKCDVGRTVTVV